MNKVRIVLSVIVILTVVGGVFAFKSKRGNVPLCTIAPINNACPTRKCMGSVKAMVDPLGPDKLCVNTAVTVNCTAVDCILLKNIVYEE